MIIILLLMMMMMMMMMIMMMIVTDHHDCQRLPHGLAHRGEVAQGGQTFPRLQVQVRNYKIHKTTKQGYEYECVKPLIFSVVKAAGLPDR